MHKSNEDCFYFLTSSCAKGASCAFRHSPVALASNVICPLWTRGNCLDPACPNRHTTASQRPMIGNGILCFYENTPMGCLKPDCTFVHSRPRTHLRNASMIRPSISTLINKDVSKPTVTKTPSIDTTQAIQNSSTDGSLSETPLPTTTPDSSSVVKTEIVTRRVAVPSNAEQKFETKPSSDNNTNPLSPIKSTNRSVITDSSKGEQEVPPPTPTPTPTQSRIIINRNVVMAEPTTIIPSRKVVQTTVPTISTSTRVVVSSEVVSSSKEKRNNIDVNEQENKTKKFKSTSPSIIDIQFPCSTPMISNRLTSISSKETTSVNDTKPVRLNRDRLPASKISNEKSSTPVSKSTSEDKLSAGTELSQDEERRTMRIERFQKKPISPPGSSVSSSSPIIGSTNDIINDTSTPRNVITSSANERKRPTSETISKDSPPSKRLSTLSPSICNTNGKKQVDKSVIKTTSKNNSSTVSSSEERPRLTPQLIIARSLQSTSSTKPSRLRQPPLVSVTAPSQTSTKSSEQNSSNPSENRSSSLKPTLGHSISNSINEEDENQLLKLTESTDIVDTFALIDEALLEADNLLELM